MGNRIFCNLSARSGDSACFGSEYRICADESQTRADALSCKALNIETEIKFHVVPQKFQTLHCPENMNEFRIFFVWFADIVVEVRKK